MNSWTLFFLGDDHKSLIKEIRAMKDLKHENVLELLGFTIKDGWFDYYDIFLMTPIQKNDQLKKYLQKPEQVSI